MICKSIILSHLCLELELDTLDNINSNVIAFCHIITEYHTKSNAEGATASLRLHCCYIRLC